VEVMKTILILLVCVVAAWAYQPHELNARQQWLEFLTTYDKVYTNEEAASRFAIFKRNLKVIDRLNKQSGTASYAINKFADLTPQERAMRYKMTYFRSGYSDELYRPLQVAATDIPASFDWRTNSSAITAVKDQGQCGSCWAFSATEEIESQWILKGNPVVNLAPQQIVDCDTTDAGCGGGDTPTAYQYVIKAGGMQAETTYPYKAKDMKCSFNVASVVAKISGWQYVVRKKNETEMLGALAAAPLSICVDASTWDFYNGGVVSSNCGHQLDHCVQAVGWGTDAATGLDYWNIRNSWGVNWGEKGYIRVQRNNGNLCGIASEVTIAII